MRSLLMAAVLLGLTACASFTSSLDSGAKPDPKLGYLYARLTLTGTGSQGFCHLRAGLTLEQLDGSNRYNLEFDTQDDLMAIAVKPGTYRLHSLIYTSCDSEVLGERLIPTSEPILAKPFTVGTGVAYYLADMVVQVGMDPNAVAVGRGGEAPVGQTEMTWQLMSAKDNHFQTTRDFHARYPKLAELPTALSINATH